MPRPRGFTLLELLLVVALVSLLAGIVAPRVLGWAEAARARAALDALRGHLLAQPALAFHAQRPRVLTQAPEDWPLPAGWRMELAAPLRWEANGMAAAGRVRILAGTDQLADWVLQAPGGEVRAATPADGPFGAGTAGRQGNARAPWAASAPAEGPAAAPRP
jgi:prepilin-type N-terminal cleavage/methylation domain-containing protein